MGKVFLAVTGAVSGLGAATARTGRPAGTKAVHNRRDVNSRGERWLAVELGASRLLPVATGMWRRTRASAVSAVKYGKFRPGAARTGWSTAPAWRRPKRWSGRTGRTELRTFATDDQHPPGRHLQREIRPAAGRRSMRGQADAGGERSGDRQYGELWLSANNRYGRPIPLRRAG